MTKTFPLISWLLAAETPSIQFYTLTALLDLPAHDERVIVARQAIMQKGPVPAILEKQTETGQWTGEHSYYTPKYVSTHWSLMLLTELGVDGRNPRFQQGVDYMLTETADGLQKRLDTNESGFSCFWGNALRYAHHAGKLDDARVQKIIQYAAWDVSDRHCQCEYNWHFACAWGVVRTLWSLAAIPQAQRSPEVKQAIASGITFLLDSFQLIEANYPTSDQGKVHPLWFKLNFPLFYQTDILFTLRILAELDVLDHPGAQPALDWLAERRGRNGRWRGSSPYRQRTWAELGDRAETNRWVSLQAATILKKAGRLSFN